jgi:hypothetical protein
VLGIGVALGVMVRTLARLFGEIFAPLSTRLVIGKCCSCW